MFAKSAACVDSADEKYTLEFICTLPDVILEMTTLCTLTTAALAI